MKFLAKAKKLSTKIYDCVVNFLKNNIEIKTTKVSKIAACIITPATLLLVILRKYMTQTINKEQCYN